MDYKPAITKAGVFMKSVLIAVLAIVGASELTACSSSNNSDTAGLNPPVLKKATRETYLSGTKFCDTYIDTEAQQTSTAKIQEFGKFVSVPKDYGHPEKGTLSIYAYTLKPFDPSKPSYIYVDGGPGQNSHGLMPEYLDGAFNEIRFDQRGLGCSAPATWEEYRDSSLYSSLNNVRDMEEIRKAYRIQKWAIYGVSYGTVPSTMYGAMYPESTVSVVLEGTVGRPEMTHMVSYKAEKLNLVIEVLNSAQRESFTRLVSENSDDTNALIEILMTDFYLDKGQRTSQQMLQKLIESDGTIRRDLFEKVRRQMKARENRYPLPQQPGATDENILDIIYCKNLGLRQKSPLTLSYSPTDGFTTVPSRTDYDKQCDDAGVKISDEQPYRLEYYKISKPVYYFQGSHDGATLAIGALAHWRTIPQGASFFLLAQKGGHNPNLTRLDSKIASLVSEEKKLFRNAVSAIPISNSDLTSINFIQESFQKWLLYTNPNAPSLNIEDEFRGIHRNL